MNKWITLAGTAFIGFVFAYSTPITLRNPSTSNIIISIILGLLVIGGVFLFFKGTKTPPAKPIEINGQVFRPA